jgi:proteic killer suppression protein/toxin YoeB
MKKRVGETLARAIKLRCDQLKAAPSFDIFLSTGLGKPHSLVGDLKGCYRITISRNFRLIISPDVDSNDPASLKKCDVVTIKGVVDYYGQKYNWLIS